MRITEEAKIQELFAPDASDDFFQELVEMIARTGAVLNGHFRLQSGLHSQYFLRFGQVAFHPGHAKRIAQLLLDSIELESGSVLLAAETAPRFLAEALSEETGLEMKLAAVGRQRRPKCALVGGESLEATASALVVSDVLNTGGSVSPLIELARRAGAKTVRLLSFATLRADGAAAVFDELGIDGVCLLRGRWPTYQPDDCELCGRGVELLPGFEFI